MVNSYDLLPYHSEPFALSRPQHLSVLAQLFGHFPAPADKANVLELGCGSGNNIIPLAALSPESQFIGIDGAESQITLGKRLISELGLKNIELLHARFADFIPDTRFDYIICHGVYSWVDEATQNEIIATIRSSLSENGLGFVSYNTLPGWHLKSIAREAMLFHTREIADPKKKVIEARAYLNFLAFGTADLSGPNHQILQSIAKGIEKLPDWYVFHDFLEENNKPIYFSDFNLTLENSSLKHLVDADISLFVPQEFSPEVQVTLRKLAKSTAYLEQTTDFLRNQSFRKSIVCRSQLKTSTDPLTLPIKNFYLSSPLKLLGEEDEVKVFSDPISGNNLQTKDPAFASCLKFLGSIWPMSVKYEELLAKSIVEDSEALLRFFLRGYISGSVYFDSLPPAFSLSDQEKPRTSLIARELEKHGPNVVNLKHENIELDDKGRKVLSLADGTKSKAEISQTVDFDIEQTLSRLKEHCLISGF